MAILKEKRKTDGRTFKEEYTGTIEVNKIKKVCTTSIDYTLQDLKQKKCKMTLPKHIRSGENIIVKIGGKVYQRMNAIGRWGQKEKIEDILLLG